MNFSVGSATCQATGDVPCCGSSVYDPIRYRCSSEGTLSKSTLWFIKTPRTLFVKSLPIFKFFSLSDLLGNIVHTHRKFTPSEQLDVPTCRRSTVGGHAFPVAGVKLWNSLPSDVTSASSLSVYKNTLKTYLFRHCYETV